MSQISCYSSSYVKRIQFLRGIQSHLMINDILKCTIIFCDEFNSDLLNINDINGDNLANRFRIELVELQSNNFNSKVISSKIITSIDNKLKLIYHETKQTIQIQFQLPLNPGFYYLSINYDIKDDNILIVSIYSDVFVTYSKEMITKYSSMILCNSFRIFVFDTYNTKLISNQYKVYIKEEYGITLGSHVYDSSIVLLRYFDMIHRNKESILHKLFINHHNFIDHESNNTTMKERCINTGIAIDSMEEILATIKLDNDSNCKQSKNILELGSGCGLISIWIYKMLTLLIESNEPIDNIYNVYVTDKAYQLDLINYNIRLNSNIDDNSDNKLICKEFDWYNNNHIKSYQELFQSNNHLDLIIACDVLYDSELADQLFKIIQILSKPYLTKIIIVQKIRNNDNKKIMDLFKLKDHYYLINIKQEYIEYNVIIWSFMLSSLCKATNHVSSVVS